jgi:hypothetical protein
MHYSGKQKPGLFYFSLFIRFAYLHRTANINTSGAPHHKLTNANYIPRGLPKNRVPDCLGPVAQTRPGPSRARGGGRTASPRPNEKI